MRRIISGTLLIGIIIPIFVGLFPVITQAQSAELANTEECNILSHDLGINNLEDLQNDIERTTNSIQFIQSKAPLLINALDSFTKEEELAAQVGTTDPLEGDGFGSEPTTDSGQTSLELHQQGLDLVKQFNDSYPTTINIEPDLREGLLGIGYPGSWYDIGGLGLTIDKSTDELKRNVQAGIRLLEIQKSKYTIQQTNAMICQEQSQANPDQATIDNLRQQLDQTHQNERALEETAIQENIDNGKVLTEEISSWDECGILHWSMSVCVRDGMAWIFKWLVRIAAFILYYVSQLFNWVIKVSIVDFKSIIDGGGTAGDVQGNGLAVMVLWKTFRDIANMMAIFVLLYIAGSTILQLGGIDTQKTITWLIVVALLINFSAVFTRMAIDTSNVIALTFYDRFAGSNGSEPNIAGAFTKAQGLDILLSDAASGGSSVDDQSASLAKSLGVLIMILVTIFVLMMSAGFFVVRMVSLILLIITSPLAFMGYVVPWIKSQVTDKWWAELKAQLTFAPVFMGLLYITISLAQGAEKIKFIDATNSTIGTTVMYVMITMMMFACLTIARSSARGVASSKLKSFGLGGAALAGAGVGLLGANTIGRFAQSRVEAGKGGAWTNRLARATYNPYTFTAGNIFKAENKVTDVLSGKGGEIKNKSFRDAQQSADKAKKEKAKARVDEHKYNMKGMATDAEKAKYVASISNEDERKELYKELTVAERGKYEAAAKTAGDTSTEGRLKEMRDKLKDEDQEKTDRAYNQANRAAVSKTSKEEIIELASIGTTSAAILANPIAARLGLTAANLATEIETRVKQIGPDGIMKISREKTVMDTILANPLINEYFTPSFLTKIEKAWLEENAVSDGTITSIYRRLYTPIPPPPATLTLSPKQKALNDWFDYNVTFR